MRNKILVNIEDYKGYTNKNGTNKLDSNNEIYANGGLPLFLNLKEEIFEGVACKYEFDDTNKDKILVKFNTNSGTEYRIDLLKEPDSEIYHIGFSLSESDLVNTGYHDKTNKNESIEVFSKMIWILKDITPILNISEYCIGATGDPSKDRIYVYMMKYIHGWEKKETSNYNLGWALYFKLK